MFKHGLIFSQDLAYCPEVQMWGSIYIAGEGQ